MTTYNTGNPIGSTSVKDLYDNAENLDTLVNDRTQESHPDRLGVPRKTWHGMEQDFNADQLYRENEFIASQEDKQNRFNNFIASSGYQFLGDYASGIEITEYNQIVRDADGEFWRLSGQVELPYTTTGDWGDEEGLFVSVGDAALRQELASPYGAEIVGFHQGGHGSVARTSQDKMRDTVSVKDFGVIGDGVADDTLAMLAAWDFCRTSNKTLLISGSIRVSASSVPIERFHNTFYVYASSMLAINEAELLVEGKIGFDLTGVDRTLIQGFKVTTANRQMTESEQPTSSPYLFYSGTGTKTSAVYRDLTIYNTVTDLTGAYRAGQSISEYGCDRVAIDNVVTSNSTTSISIANSVNVVIRNVYGHNVQTNLYLSNVTNYQVKDVHLINTKQQADYWIGRLSSPARDFNGLDNLLVEGGNNGTISGLYSEWAIERCAYIQSSNTTLSNSYALNSDGFKMVGVSYTNRTKNIYLKDCHVLLDEDFAFPRGRNNVNLLSSYWASEIHVYGCSATTYTPGQIANAFVFGFATGGTSENIYIKDCQAINVPRLVASTVASVTATQLASLVPPASFLMVKNISIENCYVRQGNQPSTTGGIIFEAYNNNASADALTNYAVEGVQIHNNVVDFSTSGATTAWWIFNPRFCNGVLSTNTQVDKPFQGTNQGYFVSSVLQPYANIRMKEEYLKIGRSVGEIIERLGNLSVLAGSSLRFSSEQYGNITAEAISDGTFLDQRVFAEFSGKGYRSLSLVRDCALEMTAKGDFYFGKMVGGAIVDQVGTPPVALTASSTDLQVRGDLQPTVNYHLTMTLL